MDIAEQIKLFIEPNSVALIGVSNNTDERSLSILPKMLDFGFSGKIYVINRHSKEILGIRAYPDLKSVPGSIDLAVVSTATFSAPDIVRECVDVGVKAIIITSQGFADADAEGVRLQQEIVRIAKKGGARIIGPNTLGVVNHSNKFNTSFATMHRGEEKTFISFVMQSGTFSQGISHSTLVWKGFDLGNTCDVDFADVLEYLEDDPDTKLIALHIEGIENGSRFLKVAHRVARKKPILALKTGISERGARAAASHTGSMVGRDEVYEAAFKQAGIIRVRDVDELEDVMKALLYLPPMRGRRVAMATVTGAAGVIASDACESSGLEMATLSERVKRKFAELSPDWLFVGNPMDILPACFLHGYQETYRTCIKILLEDENVDCVICFVHAIEPGKGEVLDESNIIKELATDYDKPIIPWVYWGLYTQEQKAKLERTKRIVVYPTIERAIRALAAQRKYLEFRESCTEPL